jgi:archaemetzincin
LNRQQYCSTEILARLIERAPCAGSGLLGLTCFDLYIPMLTFVFGEAQLKGSCAIVSTHRLRQEFYGLPPDARLLRERLLKEAVHELGHTFGLRHCADHECVMAASHAVEWIDVKTCRFCSTCRTTVASFDAVSAPASVCESP